MPNTANYNLPYPNLTDPPNGPSQIQALAEATDAAVDGVDYKVGSHDHRNHYGFYSAAVGKGTITTGAAGAVNTVAVTFPAGHFADPPDVVTVSIDTSRPDLHAVSYGNVTANGFTLYIWRNSGSATIGYSWAAFQPPG